MIKLQEEVLMTQIRYLINIKVMLDEKSIINYILYIIIYIFILNIAHRIFLCTVWWCFMAYCIINIDINTNWYIKVKRYIKLEKF